MAEGIIFTLATSAVKTIAYFTGDYAVTEFKGLRSVVKEDLKAIANDLESITSVLADAEAKQYSNETMKIWLRDLKSIVYDIDDLLDEVSTDAKQRTVNKGHLFSKLGYYLSLEPQVLHNHLSHEIKDLRLKLERVVNRKQTFSLTNLPVEAPSVQRDVFDACGYVTRQTILGRDDAKNDIINRALCVDKKRNLTVLPILGMGGIGKTALAKLVYDDINSFDIKLWARVSDKFEIKVILGDLLKDTSNNSLQKWVKKLKDKLGDKKYFLVLDDMWEDDVTKWSMLKSILDIGVHGSVILITTRIEKVANICKTVEPFYLGELPYSLCWRIFRNLAFAEGDEERYQRLCEIGRSIVEKCCAVPLVVQSLGSLLRSERNEEEWLRINNMNTFGHLDGRYNNVKNLLKLSYDKLPFHLKLVFTHLSLFPKDYLNIPIVQMHYYSALGLLELPAENYSPDNLFIELFLRFMLHDVQWGFNNTMITFKIHDLFHDLAGDILRDDLTVVNDLKFTIPDSSRYIAWRLRVSHFQEFPEKLKGKNARSFMFQYKANIVISLSFIKGIISYMPRLRILDLRFCQFAELPTIIWKLKHLRVLDMSHNVLIKSLPYTVCELLNLEFLALLGCNQLTELPLEIYKLISLRFLNMTTRQKSLVGTKFNKLPSLRHLYFSFCTRLESLWESDDVGSLASLHILGIYDCPQLTSLPNSMKLLVGLEKITIMNCAKLDLERGDALSGLHSLRALHIGGVPSMSFLPNDIRSAANSLKYLKVTDCGGLIGLSTCFESFTSLERLSITGCPNFLSLPGGIRHLKSLQRLNINKCPHLTRRCATPDGEDLSLIRHVPEIVLDGHRLTPN